MMKKPGLLGTCGERRAALFSRRSVHGNDVRARSVQMPGFAQDMSRALVKGSGQATARLGSVVRAFWVLDSGTGTAARRSCGDLGSPPVIALATVSTRYPSPVIASPLCQIHR
jgi:hypothetical protein